MGCGGESEILRSCSGGLGRREIGCGGNADVVGERANREQMRVMRCMLAARGSVMQVLEIGCWRSRKLLGKWSLSKAWRLQGYIL